MEYKKLGEKYYVRFDLDDEIISGLIDICKKNNIKSATFSGIGGCKTAEIQTFIPEKKEFETTFLEGMLELISINGNIISDDKNYYHHTHALYTYLEGGAHKTIGGHMKSTKVLYTAEIELNPVMGGAIKRKYDPVTNTGFWDFQ